MEPVENGIYRFELYNSQSSKCKVTFFSVSPACVFLEGRKAFGKAREEEASTMLVLLLLLLDSTISRGCFYIGYRRKVYFLCTKVQKMEMISRRRGE